MTAVSGRMIYRHRSLMDNSSLKALRLVAAIAVGAWFLLAALYFGGAFWEAEKAELYDPVAYILFGGGVGLLAVILLFPFLFFPDRFAVTSTGIQTPYSPLKRMTSGNPRFVEYRDIDRIFPQFVPGFKYPDGRQDPDLFHSIVLILRDGRRLEIDWGREPGKPSKESIDEFRKLFERCPKAFKEKWTDLPVMSEEHKKISKLIEGKDEKIGFQTGAEKINFGLVMFFLVLIMGGFIPLLFIEGLDPLWMALSISFMVLMVIPMVFFIMRGTRLSQDVQKTRASISILEAHGKGERVELISGGKRAEMVQEKIRFEPVSQEELDKALKAVGKYNPTRNGFLLGLGITGVFAGIFLLVAGDAFWPLYIAGPVVIVIGIAFFILPLAVLGMGDIDLHKLKMEAVLADEVRLRKGILPADYRMPDWFFMKRGTDPVSREDLDKIRKWTRFSTNQSMVIFIGLLMGGMILTLALMPFFLIFDIPAIIMVLPLLTELITAPFGFVFLIKNAGSRARLAKIGKWEERSGVEVLPSDLRERWKKWESQSQQASGSR